MPAEGGQKKQSAWQDEIFIKQIEFVWNFGQNAEISLPGMQKEFIKLAGIFIFAILFGFGFFSLALASETNGTIDSTYKYAWSNYAGWINFGAANGNVQITDSGITGYIWNENYGWINMAPTYGGVQVASNGALSGHAWGENIGWIDFSGASINCSGQFTGTATGDTIGTITFTCVNCSVLTDYRPPDCRTSGPPGPPGPGPICGDEICNGLETCANCPQDCEPCIPVCGDRKCEPSENCETCPQNCGICKPPPFCGDRECKGDETCQNCPQDCGACPPPALTVSCFASPNPELVDKNISFNSLVSGGAGGYSYLWTNGCVGTDANCAKSFSEPGTYSAILNVTSLGDLQKKSADCSVVVNISPPPIIPPPALTVSCFASPNPAVIDEVTQKTDVGFNSTVSGGTGVYDYSWTGDCEGRTQNCTTFFPGFGTYTAILEVSSGQGSAKQTKTATCSVNVQISLPPPPTEPPPPLIPPIIPQIIPQIITTTGLIITIIATAFASPFSLPELLLIPTRLLGALLIAFGWKKRNPPWGVVYDSITKQPLDPAYVALKDLEGKDISSAITDIDGRYGFLAEPGFYKMSANKTNYIFPSQKLAGKTKDELYDNLYFGDSVEIKRNEVITRNIPLDPLKFDWNEFTKQNKSLTKFYTRWDLVLREISDLIYYIGFITAVIAFFAAPYPYNTIILGLYVFLLVLRILGIKPKSFGCVVNKDTGAPLAFAIIRIADPYSNQEISHRITDKYGRYFCLVPKGKYYAKIEKKNDDQSYSLIHASPVIDASKNGIIKEVFKVSEENVAERTVPPPPASEPPPSPPPAPLPQNNESNNYEQ